MHPNQQGACHNRRTIPFRFQALLDRHHVLQRRAIALGSQLLLDVLEGRDR